MIGDTASQIIILKVCQGVISVSRFPDDLRNEY